MAERLVSNGTCVECLADARNKRRKTPEGKQAHAKSCKKWRDAHLMWQRETNRTAGWKRRNLPSPTRPRPANCECCGRPAPKEKVLVLDHNHLTGNFRGWLCDNCNHGLGLLGDSLQGLLRAIDYLCNAEHGRDENSARNILSLAESWVRPSAGTSHASEACLEQARAA